MSHHIYTTEAFVLDSRATGEADRFYYLFTKDLGLVRATGRGVRLQKSKLRPNLQDFSLIILSIVRGKEVWRITNAKVLESIHAKYTSRKAVLEVISHIFALIKRLVAGEEKNQELFLILKEAIDFIDIQNIDQEHVRAFELMAVIKILGNLGYIGEKAELTKFVAGEWSPETLKEMNDVRSLAVKEINSSLKETQL